MIVACELARRRMRRHRHELGFLRVHIGRKPRKRLGQILDRSLVFAPRRVDQGKEYDNPKNAAYHLQHFHWLVRLFASLDWNCNDNRMLDRGSAEQTHFRRMPRMLTKKLEKTV